MSHWFEFVPANKFAIWQGYIKGVFFRVKTSRPKAIPPFGVIDAAVTCLPILVPVTHIVWNEIVVRIGRFANPEEGRHRSLELGRASQQDRLHKKGRTYHDACRR